MPLELTRVGIERNDRSRVQVVARPLSRVVIGPWVPDAPIGQIEIRIVGAGDPDRATSAFPSLRIAICGGHRGAVPPRLVTLLARSRNGVEAPGFLARFCIVGGEE